MAHGSGNYNKYSTPQFNFNIPPPNIPTNFVSHIPAPNNANFPFSHPNRAGSAFVCRPDSNPPFPTSQMRFFRDMQSMPPPSFPQNFLVPPPPITENFPSSHNQASSANWMPPCPQPVEQSYPVESKETILTRFLNERCTSQKSQKKVCITVGEFRQALQTAFCLIEALSHTKTKFNPEEYSHIALLKKQCQDVCQTISDSLPIIQRKLKRIHKKRIDKRHLRCTARKTAHEEINRRDLLHKQLDAWHNDLHNKELQKKKEEELKKEADAILGEVRRKIHEATRALDRLQVLEKLRMTRQATALARGVQVSPELGLLFESRVREVRSTLLGQLSDYEAEERALLVMLEEERAESTEAVRAWGLKRNANIQEALFGKEDDVSSDHPLYLFYTHHTAANKDLQSLLYVRHQWDAFLSEEGESIPLQWVAPMPPTSDAWEPLMDISAESAYSTPVANSTLLPLLLLSLVTQKHAPSTSKKIQSEYDYIIVGAGSAGSVVANRLSEIPCVSVLLLEAGKSPPILTDVPGYARSFRSTDIDWNYTTTPQKYTERLLNNNQVLLPRGKALGGSSILNSINYVRGNQYDFDDWAAMGATGWSSRDVFPYFLKLEDNRNLEFLDNGFHSSNGPLTVELPNYQPEIKHPLIRAAENLGYEVIDSNGYRQTGIYDNQGTLRNQQRCSTAKAYLVPAENRTNLDILPNAFVEKIIIENGVSVGVAFAYGDDVYKVRARGEVIISAGAYNTPQILMLSGIGPKEELKKFSIEVKADLPVGKNLQDHCRSPLSFAVHKNISRTTEKLRKSDNIKQYIQARTGPLASTFDTILIAFLNTKAVYPFIDFPNVQFSFVESDAEIVESGQNLKRELYEQVFKPYKNIPFFQCLVQASRPKSRGFVKLQSANPYDPPIIDPNYLEHSDDVRDTVEGKKK